MNEEISNRIAFHQKTINDLKEIKKRVETNITDNVKVKVKLRIETTHWYDIFDPIRMISQDRLDVSIDTMIIILEEAIKKEKEEIDRLIDLEIMTRNTRKSNKK